MTRRRFVAQTTFVVALALMVSWPQFTTVRAASVWMYPPAADVEVASALVDQAAAANGGLADVTAAGAATARAGRSPFVSDAVRSLGGQLNAIVGRVRSFFNQPIPFARVVLRDIVTGRVVASTTADENGNYTFLDVEGNAYIVELLGPDGSVLGASETVSARNGEIQVTTLRAGARASRALGLAGGAGTDLTATGGDGTTTFEETLTQATQAATGQDVTGTEPDTQTETSSRGIG